MSDVFMIYLFYFQIRINISDILLHRIDIITGMQEYIKHMILTNLQLLYTYNENSLHNLSIFYNISMVENYKLVCE